MLEVVAALIGDTEFENETWNVETDFSTGNRWILQLWSIGQNF